MSSSFEMQPVLENSLIRICPLLPENFDTLYYIASDPLVWEQHPNKNRYQREVFQVFFEGAIQSKGAFLVMDVKSKQAIGSSRFYDVDMDNKSVAIGYTFFGRDYWGGGYNRALKTLMLNHAFKFIDRVFFHIGAGNIRSQKAIEKLGAIKIEEKEIAYHGEQNNLNFVYSIEKAHWFTEY